MSGALMNYDFGQKRNWRRWAWNRIAGHADSGLVVYMPGAQDYDKEIARAKGFKANDLIGVERINAAATQAREQGALVVCGDFFDAVDCISLTRDISVVFADLCCGLTKDVALRFIGWLQNPHMFKTVFVVNMLRGRDADTNGWRTLINGVFNKEGRKHRGMQLHDLIATSFLDTVDRCLDEYPDDRQSMVGVCESFEFYHKPSFGTYKSIAGNQVFDSVVFVNPWASVFTGPLDACIGLKYRNRVNNSEPFNSARAKKTRRSAAAVLAHKTMRDNKIGIYR